MKKSSRKESDLAIFILAGGLSTRMGRDKALIQFGGETVVERLARMAKQISPQVFLVVDRAEKLSGLKLGGVEAIEDIVPRRGPLGGIHSALSHKLDVGAASTPRRSESDNRGGTPLSRAEWNLFLTCDMPLMTAGLLKKLAATRDEQWDAAHFALKGETFPQPFPLLLHRCVAQRVARRIKKGNLSVLSLLDSLSVKTISVQRVSEMARFANVNTPAELRRLRKG